MTTEVITFGCRLNALESVTIKNHAENAGLNDAIIINSCAVTSEAERQLRQAVRKQRKLNPNKKIILTGCAAQADPKKYSEMPEIDRVIGNTEKMQGRTYNSLFENNEKLLVNDIMSVTETAGQMAESFVGKARAFLQVQNGCNHRCTFCYIPYGRGNSRSVPAGEVVEHAKKLVDNGYKEIVLTGVDLTAYGEDLPGKPTLGHLVARILKFIPDLGRLRLSSIDVAEVDESLRSIMISEKRFMPHIHLSLQAGDNMVLKRMKRRHNREQVLEFCADIRKHRPEVTFGADIIAGFPTETEEMFANTCDLVEETNLIYLHVFPYSERPNTPAAKMPAVAKDIRKKRAAILRELGKKQLQHHYKNKVGKVESIIIEQGNQGYAEDYSLIKIINNVTDNLLNQVVKVKVIGYEEGYCIAEILSS